MKQIGDPRVGKDSPNLQKGHVLIRRNTKKHSQMSHVNNWGYDIFGFRFGFTTHLYFIVGFMDVHGRCVEFVHGGL